MKRCFKLQLSHMVTAIAMFTVIKFITIGLYVKRSWSVIKIGCIQCKIKYSLKLYFVPKHFMFSVLSSYVVSFWICEYYSVIQKDGLNFVSLYFKIRTSDIYDMA